MLRPLRILRALRPLRLIQRLEGMKRIVGSLATALPEVGEAFAIVLAVMSVFAILECSSTQVSSRRAPTHDSQQKNRVRLLQLYRGVRSKVAAVMTADSQTVTLCCGKHHILDRLTTLAPRDASIVHYVHRR